MPPRLSPSRLNDFLGCTHHSALWLAGEKEPDLQDASLELVRAKGIEHEGEVLARLEAEHGPAARIDGEGPIEGRVRATRDAIVRGARLIYQAAFTNERWVGLPDFIVGLPIADGRLAYAAEDAKLSHRAKPEHLLQLGVYARLMKEAGLVVSKQGAIHLGGGATANFDMNKTSAITARLMRRFETFADAETRNTRALRCGACSQCPFNSRCEEEWRSADSPVFTAGIRTNQMLHLEKRGVTTLHALSQLDPAKPVEGIGAEAFARLTQQARLQVKARELGKPHIELVRSEPGKGFDLLPEPAAGDLYFDMEGDPHFPGGLEYLFGVWGPAGTDQSANFLPFWAHDRAEEKTAFEQLMDHFTAHLRHHPEAHIYHYAPYETVALKRLAMQYATREIELDTLLRGNHFVDLYQIVRQAVRTSTEGYSLKDLEKIYWGARSGEVTNAGDSIVMYELWRETGERKILDEIAAYNKDDVVSTAVMHKWLEELRKDAPSPMSVLTTAMGAGDAETAESRKEWQADLAARIAATQSLATDVRASNRASPETLDLIAELLWFHDRAAKPQWWDLFDRKNWSIEELIDDLQSIGGARLHSMSQQEGRSRSIKATYRFPPQETKLGIRDQVKIAGDLSNGGTITEFDSLDGVLTLKRGEKFGPFPDAAGLIPSSPISQERLKAAVSDFAKRLISDGKYDIHGNWIAKAEDADRALLNLLERRPPQVMGLATGEPLIAQDKDLVKSTIDLIRRLDRSHLVIQGPPGTGKTYTTSHAILTLLQDGKRVAVSSNSHKAINNLLSAIDDRADEARFSFKGYKKSSAKTGDSAYESDNVRNVINREQMKEVAQLVGGTAFHFAEESEASFDYLFIDEAGQVALGNLVAMAGCARNIILVGDQMQLPQPVQGTHPGESGLSCLDYLMGEHATVPAELGVLLNVSWRMHPAVCGYISDTFYDGKLTAHPRTHNRELMLSPDADPSLRPFGVTVELIDHSGCVQQSGEETARIYQLITSLLKQSWINDKGEVNLITLEDIIVVAPYNAQVSRLRRGLPHATKVGTVDKFQGQEGVVTIVSMATSNGEDAPRGTDFLFNPNRLNVAISRAKCLAILVRSKNLLEFAPGSVKDLRNLDAFANIEEISRVCTA